MSRSSRIVSMCEGPPLSDALIHARYAVGMTIVFGVHLRFGFA